VETADTSDHRYVLPNSYDVYVGLNAWGDLPVLELSGPLGRRLDTVLAALDQVR
jgi:hypothetical protein